MLSRPYLSLTYSSTSASACISSTSKVSTASSPSYTTTSLVLGLWVNATSIAPSLGSSELVQPALGSVAIENSYTEPGYCSVIPVYIGASTAGVVAGSSNILGSTAAPAIAPIPCLRNLLRDGSIGPPVRDSNVVPATSAGVNCAAIEALRAELMISLTSAAEKSNPLNCCLRNKRIRRNISTIALALEPSAICVAIYSFV